MARETKQKAILRKELEKISTFFSAEEIHKNVKGIGIATVYRFLGGLVKQGKLHTYMCDRRAVYSKEKTSHCHFICEKTGKVVHFTIDSLDFLKDKIPGDITSFQLEVRGICKDCASD